MSLTVINCVVFNFTKKFAKMGASLSHWPSIELGKRSYNPVVVLSRGMLAELEESGVQPPNKLTLIDKDIDIDFSSALAVNSKGEIIIASMRSSDTGTVMKITTAGEIQLFCRLPPEDTETNGLKMSSLAIDGDDNVYIHRDCKPTYNDHQYKLFVFDAKGNLKHVSDDGTVKAIAVTKDKKIIRHDYAYGGMQVCDSSGELKYSFPTKEVLIDFLSISDENEIIAAAGGCKFVYIYTEEGNVKRKIETNAKFFVQVAGVAFDHVTKEVVVLTNNLILNKTWIYRFSTTGEERETTRLPFEFWPGLLTSHPSGPVALVNNEMVLYIE